MAYAIFKCGYRSFLVSAQNALKLFEILDGAEIDTDYYGETDAQLYDCSTGYVIKPADSNALSCEMLGNADKDARRDRYNARQRYEMRRALEQEDERIGAMLTQDDRYKVA